MGADLNVIARREAPRQSRRPPRPLDCFAVLAMTDGCRQAAKERDSSGFEENETRWLDNTMANLERMVDG